MPRPDLHRGAEAFHLRRCHQAGVIVLVAGKRQAEALDGIGDKADRTVVIDLAESLDQRRQVVTGEISHQAVKLRVGARLDQPFDWVLIADLVEEALAPSGAALKHQRGVELVGTIVDPAAQRFATRLAERLFQQRAVFEDDHVPTKRLKQLLITRPQALADDSIETLTVVVDNPPAIAQALLPAFENSFEDVAFVEFGIADERDHARFRPFQSPAVGADIVLHERREQRLRHA